MPTGGLWAASSPFLREGFRGNGFLSSSPTSHCLSSSSASRRRYLHYRTSQWQTSCKVTRRSNSCAGSQKALRTLRPHPEPTASEGAFSRPPQVAVCMFKFERLCSRAQAQFNPLLHNSVLLWGWGGSIHKVILYSKKLLKLLTRPDHVMFWPLTTYSILVWIFPPHNVITIRWGLPCQGTSESYAQFTLYWNLNFIQSDSCCVLGLPHLFENYETFHISASCFFLFCSHLGLFLFAWCLYAKTSKKHLWFM